MIFVVTEDLKQSKLIEWFRVNTSILGFKLTKKKLTTIMLFNIETYYCPKYQQL